MTAQAKVAPKTYKSDKPNLSVTLLVDGKTDPINFEKGLFTTDVQAEQEAIEECSLFKTRHIVVAPPTPSPREVLKAAVDAANATAKKAQDDLDALDKPAPKPTPAPKPATPAA